jgi:peptide deformylase
MAIRDIVLFPDPALTTRCEPIDTIDDEVIELVRDLADTMYAAPGIGLAAPQVGVLRRVFVIDISGSEEPNDLQVFINPEIQEKSGDLVWEEGCLSFPGLFEKINRSAHIKARATDINGQTFEIEADDLLAVAIQHELDHVNGIVFLDHVSRLKRKLAMKRYKKSLEQEKEDESDDDDDESQS